jgi:hypothetical protein
MHDPPESVQVVGTKLPVPLVVKVLTVPIGVGLDGVMVIVQVDTDPTVTGLGVQTIVVVLSFKANTGRSEVPTQNIVTDNTSNNATELPLMRISRPS